MSTRQERVQELLKVEISDIALRHIKDPRFGFVTITDVEVSKDMRHAKVFISVLGDDQQKKVSLEILQAAAGYIRGEFGRRVHMKIIPELSFRLDTAVEHGARIFELLDKVKRDEEI